MKLTIISHPQMGNVRNTIIKGEPWFVAKDVCDILGLTKYRDALMRLDEDDKGCPVLMDTPGGKQEMSTVNESGLYSLIFQSRKPEAKEFKRWVTSEVLPAIRKQGYYVHPSAQLSMADIRKLEKVMRDRLKRYITSEDTYKCSKKFRIKEWDVRDVLSGWKSNNEVMVDLQNRALANQARWVNAYDVERMGAVINKLNNH